MKQNFSSALGAFFVCALLLSGPAWAQSAFPTPGGGEVDGKATMCPNGSNDSLGRPYMVPCGGTAFPFHITGSFSASISGFQPTPSYSTGVTSASDQTVALPIGTEFILTNNGASAIAWNIGAAATGTMNVLQPNSWIAFAGTTAAGFHYIEATGAAGTSAFSISGGSGLPTGAGGGSGSSTGGGGPLGVQAINNSQAVNPATGSVWSVAGSTSTPSFQASATGAYLNIPSITNVSSVQNFALPTGSNVVLWNYGGYKVAYQLSTSGASGVAVATADGFIQPGCTAEVAVGSNTNISVGTTAAGLTSSMQVVGGSGLWTGASCNNLSVGQDGLPIPSFSTKIAGQDNGSLTLSPGVTAAGTSSTKGAMATQGVNGGVPMPVTFPGFTPTVPASTLATPLAPGASSVASIAAPTGTGATSVLIKNTGTAIGYIRTSVGSGSATANDIPFLPGDACVLTLGTATFLNAFNAAAGSSFNAIAGSGAGTCPTGGGGGSSAAAGNVFQASLFSEGDISASATTQKIAASGSLTIYLVNYAFSVDPTASSNGTIQIVTGTGSNCSSINKTLTPVWTFAAGQGIQEGSIGVLGVSSPGDALCVVTTGGANTVHYRLGVVQQ